MSVHEPKAFWGSPCLICGEPIAIGDPNFYGLDITKPSGGVECGMKVHQTCLHGVTHPDAAYYRADA